MREGDEAGIALNVGIFYRQREKNVIKLHFHGSKVSNFASNFII